MPKVRDLAISSVPLDRLMKAGPGGYQMCGSDNETVAPPVEPCDPTAPQCHPATNQEDCEATSPPGDQQARGLPAHAIVQLRQQLHDQISRQLHS